MIRQLLLSSIFLLFFSLPIRSNPFDCDTLWLDEINLEAVDQGWGTPGRNQSVDGHPITIAGKVFSRGMGTHAVSSVLIDLKGSADAFCAWIGVDDEVLDSGASVVFRLLLDNVEVWQSGIMRAGMPAQRVRLSLKNARRLELVVDDADDGIGWDHADWAEAHLIYTGEPPTEMVMPEVVPYILTPPPPATPRINGAQIYGARPNRPFLYKIPATGEKPLTYLAEGLPKGLYLDPQTGIISGVAKERGEYLVTVRVVNDWGKAERTLKIVIGDLIALTPPLGWNSWNCFACDVDDAKVRAAADAMVSSGLIDHGWTYINIDDCWSIKPNSNDQLLTGPPRDENGRIRTNQKFPDMKALCDYIHSKGLKAGIYSSPGPQTCAGYAASYQYEELDAQQWAEWGFDYLKYDWCSYGTIAKDQSPAELQKPYTIMRAALDKVPRDIIFSLCQYGMGKVWEWGTKVGGNCWRTTGDITDTWASMSTIGFGQAGLEVYAAPGHWNDPDMLVIGWVGWGPKLHPTRLTPDEQYTHITLWALLAAPLLIGCDLTRLDAFTLNLLTNDEVLEVNQDALGQPAHRVRQKESCEVWARKLIDGSLAIGLFNRNRESRIIEASWSDLGLSGQHRVRDLWRQQDLGVFNTSYSCEVPPHGAMMLRIF